MSIYTKQIALRIVAALLIWNSTTAAARNVEIMPWNGQTNHYTDGIRWAIKEDAQRGLAVTARANDRDSAWLRIVVSNKSDHAFDLIPSQIQAKLVSEQPNGATPTTSPLYVYSADEVIADQQKRDGWQNFFGSVAAIGNVQNAKQAGFNQQSGNFRGNFNQPGGNGNFNGTYSANGFNANAAQQAQARAIEQGRALNNQIQATQQDRLAEIQSRLLKSNTLSSGAVYSGDLLIALPKTKRKTPEQWVVVFVPLNGSVDSFLVRVSD